METTETTPSGVDVADMSVEDRLAAIVDADLPDETVEDAEVEASAEDAEIETSEEPESETETVELDAESLASILGIDADNLYVTDDGEVKLKTKIDGEQGQATLADLLKSYQLEGHVQKKSQALAEQQRQFEAEQQAYQAQIQQNIAQSTAMLQTLEQQMLSKYQNLDWERLRVNDPAEFSAKYAEYQMEAQQLESMKAQALQNIEYQQQQMAQNQAQQMQQVLAKEAEILTQKIPEWSDPATAEKEKTEMVGWLRDRGYPEQIIAGITSAQVVADIREFMHFKKAQDKNKTSAKPVPKLQKPGARLKKTPDKKKQAALRNKVRNGDNDALTNLLLDRI